MIVQCRTGGRVVKQYSGGADTDVKQEVEADVTRGIEVDVTRGVGVDVTCGVDDSTES